MSLALDDLDPRRASPQSATERDIAATVAALAAGRISAEKAAASLAAIVLQTERVARAEGRLEGLREAGQVAHDARAYGTERLILARVR